MNKSRNSAAELIRVLLSFYTPNSVIDVGCGVGSWLVEFQAQGITDIRGIDGNYVDRNSLLISPNLFFPADLSEDFSQLFETRFDLAVCLEVAEHIEPEFSEQFIRSLVSLSDVVLFSAALPYQGGTGHVNENWMEYWALLFHKYDYLPVDCLRPVIWHNSEISWWYRQNSLIFVQQKECDRLFPNYHTRQGDSKPLTRIHPECFLWVYHRDGSCREHDWDVSYLRNLTKWFKRGDTQSALVGATSKKSTYNVKFAAKPILIIDWVRRQLMNFLKQL